MLNTRWKKSTKSGHNGACVEARLFAGAVEVRDSKNIEGPTLQAPVQEWAGLIAATKLRGH
ncbi:MAG TPA: DUF397 domain-containing protein [Candidatus Stackebrandtia faecavium]|nr:DUF397 domain-containing protein [Candidatus Stackebrandtia faecavium]